jgi:hypothetical protein
MPYPPEVMHAFDYFLWSALDDINLLPTEPRPFGDDERHYNGVLNAHLFPKEVRRGEMNSDALTTWRRPFGLGEVPAGAIYVPYYFPDNMSYDSLDRSLTTTKSYYLACLVETRKEALEVLTECGCGETLDKHPGDSRSHLVRPDGYLDYYARLRSEGILFADASPYERERACVESKLAAVAPWGTAIEDESEWFAVRSASVKTILPDFYKAAAA